MPSTMYACRAHWFELPKRLRDEVWRAYRREGVLSDAHVAAMRACEEWWKTEDEA